MSKTLTAGKLFAFIFAIYLIFMAGHTYSPDEETLLATSVSLIQQQTFALQRNSTLVEVRGANGKLYSQYGPGQPIAALPLVGLGLLLGGPILHLEGDGPQFLLRLIAGMFNPLVTALLCALFWSTLLLLGCRRRLALALTLILAFATYLWPHSRTFFGEPLTALMLLLAFYTLLRSRHALALLIDAADQPAAAPAKRTFLLYGLIAGFALVATVAVKAQYVVALPALGLYALWLIYGFGFKRGQNSVARAASLQLLIGMAAGGLVVAVLLALYNWSAFGSPFSTGYGSDMQATFKTPLYEGLFGLLLSSGKGLWLYAPPVALALLGWSRFVRRNTAENLAVIFVALPVTLLFALYRFWPGDGAWGPRYLIPILPFLLLPAAGLGLVEAQDEQVVRRWLRPPRPALLIFGALGLLVNLLGAAVNFDTYINVVNDDATRYWNPDASPVRGHWVLLGQRWDEWRCRLLPCDNVAQLVGGFSYSEGDKFAGEIFPRWTGGQPQIKLPVAPVTVIMQLADHRPPPLPRAEVTVTATNAQINVSPREALAADSVSSVMTITVQPASSGLRPVLTLDIPTWNPHDVAGSSRDEQLGLMVEKVSVTDASGKRLPILEALPIAAMYPAPRWYYDPASHHAVDWWVWYLCVANVQKRVGFVAAGIVVIALAALLWSARALFAALRPPLAVPASPT